mgnify:CR=1 FL=1
MAIIDFFDRGWRLNPHGTAYVQDERRFSYQEAGELSCRIAHTLLAGGMAALLLAIAAILEAAFSEGARQFSVGRPGWELAFHVAMATTAFAFLTIGMALYGMKAVPEIQFLDFIYPGFDQIVSEAARLRHRSAGDFTAPITIRMPCGGGIYGGQTHSQSPEALFTHVCGLRTVMPSNPYDAKGLLIASIECDDPVIFFEPKRIYRAFREEVPEEEETFPIGRSVIAREGKDLTLIAYGAMMRPTLEAAEELKRKHGVEADVIDLLTISPLDDSLLVASARKTGRVAVVHEAPRSFGPGAEVVARLVEKAFFHLEAPVARVTGYDVIIPLFSREKYYLPGVPRIVDAARKLLAAQ